MAVKVYRTNSEESIPQDAFGTIVEIHFEDDGGVSGFLSVSGSVGECNSRSVSVTIGGYSLPVENIEDEMVSQAFMNTADIRTWLEDRGVVVGSSISVSVHVSGVSREDGEHEPPLGENVNAQWQGFISWNMSNGETGFVGDVFETGESGVSHEISLSQSISLHPLEESS